MSDGTCGHIPRIIPMDWHVDKGTYRFQAISGVFAGTLSFPYVSRKHTAMSMIKNGIVIKTTYLLLLTYFLMYKTQFFTMTNKLLQHTSILTHQSFVKPSC